MDKVLHVSEQTARALYYALWYAYKDADKNADPERYHVDTMLRLRKAMRSRFGLIWHEDTGTFSRPV